MAESQAPVIECASACTVTIAIVPQPATPEDYEAALVVFGAFLAACAAIVAAKWLLRLFDNRSES